MAFSIHFPSDRELRGGALLSATIRTLQAAALFVFSLLTSPAAMAQQATQPGFDPRQAERRFDAQQSEQRRNAPGPRVARPHWDKSAGDARPLFDLRHVAITGATAIPAAELEAAYRPYLGRKVSQADLAAIAEAVSERYRAAGYHLSRAVVPPQDIQGGRIRVQVIEGAVTELVLNGHDPESFGIRAMLAPILAERPSRLATFERRLLLLNDIPGARIVDTAIEEIGAASGKFRLIVQVKAWRVYTSLGIDNFGSHSVGPWQSYGTIALNSYILPGDSFAANFATVPTDPRELTFGRLSYDAPI